MGLDIYLYKHLRHKESKKKEEKYNKYSDAEWEKFAKGREYNTIPESELKEHQEKKKKYALSLGLSEWGDDDKNKKSIEKNSKKYPDHMFKIGYCRSSYNPGGINHVLSDLIGEDLYSIFDRTGDEYEFLPDWVGVRGRAKESLKLMDKKLEEMGPYRVMKSDHNMFDMDKQMDAVPDASTALDKFMEVRSKHSKADDFGNFSNGIGEFFLKTPLKVAAIIPGSCKELFGTGKAPCQYIIYEDEGSYEFYHQALEIVVEMAEWVLKQKNPELYYVHWSS